MNKEADYYGGGGLLNYDQFNTHIISGSVGGSNTLDNAPLTGFNNIRPVTIYWGLEPNRRDYNSGAVSLHNVTNFQIQLTCASVGTNTDWYVVNEYWTFVNVNSADGNISTSLSQ
jgi:hypothetical protein